MLIILFLYKEFKNGKIPKFPWVQSKEDSLKKESSLLCAKGNRVATSVKIKKKKFIFRKQLCLHTSLVEQGTTQLLNWCYAFFPGRLETIEWSQPFWYIRLLKVGAFRCLLYDDRLWTTMILQFMLFIGCSRYVKHFDILSIF